MIKDKLSKQIKRVKTRLDYRRYILGKYKANFIGEYKSLFRPMKFKKIKIMELGVDWGGSLLFLSDFFLHPGTKIIGLDIKLPLEKTFPRRVTVVQCDQNDTASLIKIAEGHGPFDIIIDDASHFAKETENSFNTLMQYVKPGGYYIIEDWSVGYFKFKEFTEMFEDWRYGDVNCKEYEGMTDLITHIISKAPKLDIESLRVISNISTLACFKGSMAVFKKSKK